MHCIKFILLFLGLTVFFGFSDGRILSSNPDQQADELLEDVMREFELEDLSDIRAEKLDVISLEDSEDVEPFEIASTTTSTTTSPTRCDTRPTTSVQLSSGSLVRLESLDDDTSGDAEEVEILRHDEDEAELSSDDDLIRELSEAEKRYIERQAELRQQMELLEERRDEPTSEEKAVGGLRTIDEPLIEAKLDAVNYYWEEPSEVDSESPLGVSDVVITSTSTFAPYKILRATEHPTPKRKVIERRCVGHDSCDLVGRGIVNDRVQYFNVLEEASSQPERIPYRKTAALRKPRAKVYVEDVEISSPTKKFRPVSRTSTTTRATTTTTKATTTTTTKATTTTTTTRATTTTTTTTTSPVIVPRRIRAWNQYCTAEAEEEEDRHRIPVGRFTFADLCRHKSDVTRDFTVQPVSYDYEAFDE